jgi:hypothetical protein
MRPTVSAGRMIEGGHSPIPDWQWDPDDPELLREEAHDLEAMNDANEVLHLWQQILEALPEDAEALKRVSGSETTS